MSYNVPPDRRWIVYIHSLPTEISGHENPMRYVGITSQSVNKRWQNGIGYYQNQHFTNAIKKYGWDNFEHTIMHQNLSFPEAVMYEKYYIQLCRSYDRDFGYNHSLGGEGMAGIKLSDEQKQRMSEMRRGGNSPSAVHTYQFDLLFNYVNDYECILDASKALGKPNQNSIRYSMGHNGIAYNYIWCGEDDVEKNEQGDIFIKNIHTRFGNTRHKIVYIFNTKGEYLLCCLGVRTAGELTNCKSVTVKRAAKSKHISKNGYIYRYKDGVIIDNNKIILKEDLENE